MRHLFRSTPQNFNNIFYTKIYKNKKYAKGIDRMNFYSIYCTFKIAVKYKIKKRYTPGIYTTEKN